MNVLILHGIDDPARVRRTTLNQSFCMPKHVPGHEYTFHAIHHDPSPLLGRRFDTIFLDTTFLGYRWLRPRRLFTALLDRYEFVRRSGAIKLAFPQDDYDHCAVLDRWLTDWGVQVVFTPLQRFAEVLYPSTSRSARFESSLTGYVDPLDLEVLARVAQPHADRPIHVAYRARKLPPNFGQVGRLKAEIGDRFAAALPRGHGLTLDISTDPAKTIVGDDWLAFLGRTQAFLGSASGASLLDPEGEVQDKVREFLERDPAASYEKVEAACFPGLEGRHRMTVLGPRNLECAAARTCQILVPDAGLEPFMPDVHYLALDADAGNAEAIVAALADQPRVRSVLDAAEALIRDETFTQTGFVRRIEAAMNRGTERAVEGVRRSLSEATLAERLIRVELERAELTHRLRASENALVEARDALAGEPTRQLLLRLARGAIGSKGVGVLQRLRNRVRRSV